MANTLPNLCPQIIFNFFFKAKVSLHSQASLLSHSSARIAGVYHHVPLSICDSFANGNTGLKVTQERALTEGIFGVLMVPSLCWECENRVSPRIDHPPSSVVVGLGSPSPAYRLTRPCHSERMEFPDKILFHGVIRTQKLSPRWGREERMGPRDREQGSETSRSSFIYFCTHSMEGGIGTHPDPHLIFTGQGEIYMAKAGLRVLLLRGKTRTASHISASCEDPEAPKPGQRYSYNHFTTIEGQSGLSASQPLSVSVQGRDVKHPPRLTLRPRPAWVS